MTLEQYVKEEIFYAEKKIKADALAEGREKGRVEGREEGREEGALKTLIDLVKDRLVSVQEACKRSGLTEQQFNALLSQ